MGRLKQPWDQADGEDAAAYSRFAIYLSLGPSRTILGAYRRYLQGDRLSDQVPKRVPGNWQAEATARCWRERAEQWDLWRLRTYGHRVAILYTHALVNMSRKLLRAVTRHDIGDEAWPQVLKTLEAVAAQLKPARQCGATPGYVAYESPEGQARHPPPGPPAAGGGDRESVR